MTLEEVKKELSKFSDFKFYASDHHYEYKDRRVGMSVTRLIEEFSQEFDRDTIAEKVAIKENKSVAEVLAEWDYKNKFACEKGSTCHEFAQSLWSKEPYTEVDFNGDLLFKNYVSKIQAQANNFYLDFKKTYTHIQDEQVIGAEEYDIASAIDHLFLDKNGNVDLIDYKTNSILKGYNDNEYSRRYTKNMKVPLQNLKDDSLTHYFIQLNIYKFILETHTNIKINKMRIVYFSENIDNYEIIEVPLMQDYAKIILENRRVRKMGKCIPVLIIGKSGSGKSTSLRNFKNEDYSLVNVLGKRLPFKGGNEGLVTTSYEMIKKFIEKTPKDVIIIDDSNYLLTTEMMAKAKEAGYNKFTELAKNYWDLIEFIKNLDGDKRVYLMSHEETDEFGNVDVKSVGKMLKNQCCIEGMYTIVLRAIMDNEGYHFSTKNSGYDIVKTPIGMFEDKLIDNDLKFVDDTICEYYEIKKGEEK